MENKQEETIKMMPKSWIILRDVFLSQKEKGKEIVCDKDDYRDPS